MSNWRHIFEDSNCFICTKSLQCLAQYQTQWFLNSFWMNKVFLPGAELSQVVWSVRLVEESMPYFPSSLPSQRFLLRLFSVFWKCHNLQLESWGRFMHRFSFCLTRPVPQALSVTAFPLAQASAASVEWGGELWCMAEGQGAEAGENWLLSNWRPMQINTPKCRFLQKTTQSGLLYFS